jgi:hypothetical protein
VSDVIPIGVFNLTYLFSRTRLMNEGQVPVQTTWLSNFLLAAATTFTVVILGQDHYIESQSHPLEAKTPPQGHCNGFPQQHIYWLAENIFIVLECLDTIMITGNYSASMARQLLERLCMAQNDLCKLYRVRFNKFVDSDAQQHQQRQFRNSWCEPSYQSNDGTPVQGTASSTSSVPFSSPIHPCTTTTAIHLTNGSANAPIFPSNAPTTSATSLLDAVLTEPTELDFFGQNHMDLLQSLLKDSSPIDEARGSIAVP